MKTSKLLEIVAAVLSTAVAAFLVANHAAPWKLIAIYWIAVAIRNSMKVVDQ